MMQQSTASLPYVVDAHKLGEADVSDDDASSRSTKSGSSSDRGSGASRTATRSFVWADADSDDGEDSHKFGETDVSDDDTLCRTNSGSLLERSSGASPISFARSFVWADADSDDDVDVTSFVACASSGHNQQSISRENPRSAPRVPPGCNQPFHLSGVGQQWAMVVPHAPSACFAQPAQLMHVSQSPEIEEDKFFLESRTTLIVKNLPVGCTHDQLRRILDEVGLCGLYNFIYVPYDFKKSIVFRYGFVNFEQHEDAVKAVSILEDGESGCEVEWSGAQQSLHAIIQRYRNSPVMHSSVPDAYKPLLLNKGVRIPFPAPTENVKPPKHLTQSALQTTEVRSHSLQANAEADKSAHDSRTTLIVKNLPTGCTHEELCRMLDEVGLGGMYNFIYVPFDFKKSVVLRYGFVNFEQHEQAVKAMTVLDGFSGWVVDGEKNCEVEWGGAQQSLHANIERYRNSSLMHSSVPDAYKPVLFERGVRVEFPAPTKAVKPLKLRKTQQA